MRSANQAPRSGETVAFTTCLAALAFLPWTVARWPSQDGPNHLAVVHVLLHHGDPGSPFTRWLEVEGGFRPSTATYAILAMLGRTMALETAEKLLVSAAIVLLPASLWLLLRRAVPARRAHVLLALPFAVGWPLAMGFLGYLFGMGLGVMTLALAWSPGDAGAGGGGRRALVRLVLAALCLFLSVWFHPVAAATTGLALLVLEGRALRAPASWPRLLMVAAPAVIFLAASLVRARSAATPPVPGETKFANPLELLGGLVEANVAYTAWELVPRIVALAVLVRFAWRGVRAHPPLRATAEAALGRLVLSLLVLYCVTPVAFRGWFYASTRFLLLALLLLPAMAEIPPAVVRRLPLLAPALTAVVVAVQWPDLHRTSRQLQDVLDAGEVIPRGATLVPMDFAARLLGPQPLAHAWAELVVERDAMAPQLFAVGKQRFGGEAFRTLTFRPEVLDPATGALAWPGGEGWYDVVRKCDAPRWIAALASGADDCAAALARRKATLDAVLDRYDYVLMIDPPDYARALVDARVSLAAHVGSAWMFRVAHQGQGFSYSRSH